jgi:hypothetical protein
MDKMIDKYKVDVLEGKLFTNGWGIVNQLEKAHHIEALCNERYGQGYKLINILENFTTTTVVTCVFEKVG